MFGCLGRLGCLLFLAVLAAAGWFTRGLWYDRVAGTDRPAVEATAGTETWKPVVDAGSLRTRAALGKLQQPRGPVFVNLDAADIVSYTLSELRAALPPSTRGLQARVLGERVYVKGEVSIEELGRGALGPLAAMLPQRDTLTLGGTFEVLRPGLAQLRVEEIRVGELALPARMIPRIVSQARRGQAAEGVAENGLAVRIPEYIGDVRVGRGFVTLYKTSR